MPFAFVFVFIFVLVVVVVFVELPLFVTGSILNGGSNYMRQINCLKNIKGKQNKTTTSPVTGITMVCGSRINKDTYPSPLPSTTLFFGVFYYSFAYFAIKWREQLSVIFCGFVRSWNMDPVTINCSCISFRFTSNYHKLLQH